MIHTNPSIFNGNLPEFLASNQPFYACPMHRARNILGLPFAAGNGHPFTEGMIDYLNDSTLKASHTRMKKFYDRFQPTTLFDALFQTRDHPLIKSLSDETIKPLTDISSKDYLVPWVEEAIPMGGFGQNMPKDEGSHYLGPVSHRHLFSEYERIKSVVNSIRRHGFDVAKQTDTIRGYFLTHNDDTVCIIVGGNHRVGALAALKSDTIPVERHPDRPTLVTLDHVHEWPMVQNGRFSPDLAKAVFLRFFTSPIKPLIE